MLRDPARNPAATVATHEFIETCTCSRLGSFRGVSTEGSSRLKWPTSCFRFAILSHGRP